MRIFDLATIHGANLGRPHSAPLKNDLFEFKVKGKKGIARSLFITLKGKRIIILHTIIKKKSQIPKKDLELALKRAKEIK